jgi:hypothetical protein
MQFGAAAKAFRAQSSNRNQARSTAWCFPRRGIIRLVRGSRKGSCQQGRQQQRKAANSTALTPNFKQTVIERVERDPAFAKALLDEAATLFLNGQPETARLILRDLINATIAFEQRAALTAKPSKSLHRMLSPAGNPQHGQPGCNISSDP